jgi:hypothetical protein
MSLMPPKQNQTLPINLKKKNQRKHEGYSSTSQDLGLLPKSHQFEPHKPQGN